VLRAQFRGGGQREDIPRTGTVGGNDVRQTHASFGDGPRLVEEDGIHGPNHFENLAALEEDSELRRPSASGHDRRGGGQTEGARASDKDD
jgi:hypothetical protein